MSNKSMNRTNPTAWYREQAEENSDTIKTVLGYALSKTWNHPEDFDVIVYKYARLAAHFGRLALGHTKPYSLKLANGSTVNFGYNRVTGRWGYIVNQ